MATSDSYVLAFIVEGGSGKNNVEIGKACREIGTL
jgi:hypothetical protein